MEREHYEAQASARRSERRVGARDRDRAHWEFPQPPETMRCSRTRASERKWRRSSGKEPEAGAFGTTVRLATRLETSADPVSAIQLGFELAACPIDYVTALEPVRRTQATKESGDVVYGGAEQTEADREQRNPEPHEQPEREDESERANVTERPMMIAIIFFSRRITTCSHVTALEGEDGGDDEHADVDQMVVSANTGPRTRVEVRPRQDRPMFSPQRKQPRPV